MRTALATVLLYLSSLPGPGSTSSNLFEVHEFLFMNKSILYLWKRRSNPKADRFCLCYGPSAAMSRHFGAFNCSASRRGALCHVRDSFAGCFGNAELAQASPQRRDAFVIPARLPSLPPAESTTPGGQHPMPADRQHDGRRAGRLPGKHEPDLLRCGRVPALRGWLQQQDLLHVALDEGPPAEVRAGGPV
ncbi:hypothetical protein MTO96_000082 [Rhipicephalus appendiculatus]